MSLIQWKFLLARYFFLNINLKTFFFSILGLNGKPTFFLGISLACLLNLFSFIPHTILERHIISLTQRIPFWSMMKMNQRKPNCQRPVSMWKVQKWNCKEGRTSFQKYFTLKHKKNPKKTILGTKNGGRFEFQTFCQKISLTVSIDNSFFVFFSPLIL